MAIISGLNFSLMSALIILVINFNQLGTSTATPVISSSVPESAKLLKLAEAKDMQQSNEIMSAAAATTTLSPQQQAPLMTVQKLSPVTKIPSVDKLKRGLANFISQHNPGSFFVPPAPVLQQQVGKVGGSGGTQSSSSSNLVNGDASAEAIIKGPNRLIQTRPIGGATRWGRR